MPKQKPKNHVQPSLFDESALAIGDQQQESVEFELLEPGDVVRIDGDPSEHWIVERVIYDHVAVWNDTGHDVVLRQRVARLGKMPGLVEGFTATWLRKLVNTIGYWSVVQALGARQPKTAGRKDRLHIIGVQYSDNQKRLSDVWQFYDSDLEAVAPLVDQFIEQCRDSEIPVDQAIARMMERLLEVRQK